MSYENLISEWEQTLHQARLNRRSIAGYRFIFNNFNHVDDPYWQVEQTETFFSIEQQGHEEFTVPEGDKSNRIASLYYRLDVNQMEHEREVLLIEDFFGSIAGLWDLLLTILTFLFGNLINF